MHNDGRLNSMEGGAMRTSLGDERRNNQRDEQRNNQAFNFAIIRWFWKRAGNKFVDLYDLLGITQQRFDRSMSGESIWIARKEAAHCKNVTGMDADIFTGKKRFLPNQPLQEGIETMIVYNSFSNLWKSTVGESKDKEFVKAISELKNLLDENVKGTRMPSVCDKDDNLRKLYLFTIRDKAGKAESQAVLEMERDKFHCCFPRTYLEGCTSDALESILEDISLKYAEVKTIIIEKQREK